MTPIAELVELGDEKFYSAAIVTALKRERDATYDSSIHTLIDLLCRYVERSAAALQEQAAALAMALDAADKGTRAREVAGGMEMAIEELRAKVQEQAAQIKEQGRIRKRFKQREQALKTASNALHHAQVYRYISQCQECPKRIASAIDMLARAQE